MFRQYSVSNYKIHKEHYQFDFKGLNIFTGANNSGKTSLTESLLLINGWLHNQSGYNRLPIEWVNPGFSLEKIFNFDNSRGRPIVFDFSIAKNLEDSPLWLQVEFVSTEDVGFWVGLNSAFAIMKTMKIEYEQKIVCFEIELDGSNPIPTYKVYKEDCSERKLCDFKVQFNGSMLFFIGANQYSTEQVELNELLAHFYNFINCTRVMYLSPFRLTEFEKTVPMGNMLDISGCNAADVLQKNKNEICFDGESTVETAFKYWTQKILKLDIETRPFGQQYGFVDLERGNELRRNRIALRINQIGLGISQILPIIVLVLTSHKGDCVIIENPEVHLHPRWMTELVDLFELAAQNGIQIILETQSMEIVNRIRRRSKENNAYLRNTKIWYFKKSGFDCDVLTLEIQKNGGLNYWPEDFVDAVTLEDSIELL